MEPIRLGTAPLDDDALVEAFESCQLPASDFHHADHVRLAWIYLGRESKPAAAERFEQSLQRFAAHYGVSEKYHRTMTLAWICLVAAARCATPEACTFEAFAERNSELFDQKLLNRYYTPERLASCEARARWVIPDLLDLPPGRDSAA